MEQLVLTKLACTGALLLITLLFSYFPFILRKKIRHAGLVMSYCNALAGGIVLGAMLMHMVPEMMEHAGGCSGHSHSHGVSAVASGAGAGCSHGHCHPEPLVVAEGVHEHKAHKSCKKEHEHEDKEHKHCKHSHDDKEHKHCKHSLGDKEHKHCEHSHEDKEHKEHKHGDGTHMEEPSLKAAHEEEGHSHPFAWGPFFAGVSFLVLFAIDRLFLTHSHCEDAHPEKKAKQEHAHEHHAGCSHDHGHDHDHHHHHDHSSDVEHGSCHEDDVVGCCHMDGINSASSRLQTVIFVIALSVHSFLEGLGVATKNSTASLFSFMVSLFAHKWIGAFALGTGVAKAAFPGLHAMLLIGLYAVLTPFGILLGMGLDRYMDGVEGTFFSNAMLRQMLDGLALGSFLFVSCIEMIPAEFHKQTKHSPFKFVALCVGFTFMALVSTTHFH